MTYEEYMSKQPMRDGEEMRAFFNDEEKERKETMENANKVWIVGIEDDVEAVYATKEAMLEDYPELLKGKDYGDWISKGVLWAVQKKVKGKEAEKKVEKVFSVEEVDKWENHEIVCIHGTFRTEEEADKLAKALKDNGCEDDRYELFVIATDIDDDVDAIISEKIRENNELKEKEAQEEMKRIQRAKDGIEYLKKVKEVLAPFDLTHNLTKEKFKGYVKELHKAVVDAKLDVHLFDSEYDYNSDGTIEEYVRGERISYYPISVHYNSPVADFYRYGFGNYDIDDDIAMLEEYIRERSE